MEQALRSMERQTRDWYALYVRNALFLSGQKNACSEQIFASADKSENTYYMMYIVYILIY